MFNKILVPTNFSGCAHNAAKYACDMVRGSKTSIVLLNVRDPQECTSADEHKRKENYVRASLEAEKALLKAYARDIKVEIDIYEGSFVSLPNEYFDQVNVDLIVLGSDGVDESKRNPSQTNTEQFIERRHRNMIVVPNDASYMGFGNILFASDYRFHLAGDQLDVLKHLMTQHDSNNFVVHVQNGLEELGIAQVLEKNAIEDSLSGHEPEFHEVSSEKIEDGIFKFVNSYNIDLVALIPRKHTLSERIFKNSITKKVAERVKKPMLILN